MGPNVVVDFGGAAAYYLSHVVQIARRFETGANDDENDQTDTADG